MSDQKTPKTVGVPRRCSVHRVAPQRRAFWSWNLVRDAVGPPGGWWISAGGRSGLPAGSCFAPPRLQASEHHIWAAKQPCYFLLLASRP